MLHRAIVLDNNSVSQALRNACGSEVMGSIVTDATRRGQTSSSSPTNTHIPTLPHLAGNLMARGRGNFGLSSRTRVRGSFRGRGNFRGRGRGGSSVPKNGNPDAAPVREDDGTALAEKFERVNLSDEVDEKLGFARAQEGPRREGWLINMHPVSPTVEARLHGPY